MGTWHPEQHRGRDRAYSMHACAMRTYPNPSQNAVGRMSSLCRRGFTCSAPVCQSIRRVLASIIQRRPRRRVTEYRIANEVITEDVLLQVTTGVIRWTVQRLKITHCLFFRRVLPKSQPANHQQLPAGCLPCLQGWNSRHNITETTAARRTNMGRQELTLPGMAIKR